MQMPRRMVENFLRSYVRILHAHGMDVNVRKTRTGEVFSYVYGHGRGCDHYVPAAITLQGAPAGRLTARQVLKELGCLEQ